MTADTQMWRVQRAERSERVQSSYIQNWSTMSQQGVVAIQLLEFANDFGQNLSSRLEAVPVLCFATSVHGLASGSSSNIDTAPGQWR